MTQQEPFRMIQQEIERRRKMFHWYIDGIGHHITPENHLVMFHNTGIDWRKHKHLTPDWVTKHYNIEI
jgi:hypothetical protein